MNYIKHLSGFFEKAGNDQRLNPTHISLYISLFRFWNACRFQNPISISRNEVMKVSKISSTATYHKCMRELNEYGYLRYLPSYNPFKGSLVNMFTFCAGHDQALNGSMPENKTGAEQAILPYTNNTNNNKQVKKIKGNTRTQENKITTGKDIVVPQLSEVREYFKSKNYSDNEADNFFNHYMANGWLLAGKTPMRSWQAASNKWILNAHKFNNTNNTHLHAATGKNYGEAL